jgi:hypothetical protein
VRPIGANQLVTCLAFLPFLLHAQTVDPQTLLDHVRSKVAAAVQRAPRYTCTETIERFWYANRKIVRPGCDSGHPPEIKERNLVRSDRLRLDVAVGSGQEIFTWHGQKNFQTEEIDKLVTAGPVSSGNYFAFLSSIFLDGGAAVDFRGLRQEADKQVAVFGYAVPAEESHFETRTDSGKAVMAYHGDFSVDPATTDLQRLSIITTNMPESAFVCGFSSETNYTVTLLNGKPFLLPAKVVMDLLYQDRERARTVTLYRQCHEFLAESVLSFDESPAKAAPAVPRPVGALPAGLTLHIRIRSEIDLKTAWAGDPVQGELTANVVNSQGELLIPKQTAVQGLLLRVETSHRPSQPYTLALQFQNLSVAGVDFPLHLKSLSQPVSIDPSDDPAACRFRLDKDAKLKGVVTYWVTQ